MKISLHIEDLIPIDRLQQLQDAFAQANQVASIITDIDGNPITKASNASKICKLIRASERGLHSCILTGKNLGEEASARHSPISGNCKSIGFYNAVAPIIVKGMHIANWTMGQVHCSEEDKNRVLKYVAEIDVDPNQLIELFNEVPKNPMGDFDKILEFLGIMANGISEVGYLYLKQRRQTKVLRKQEKALKQAQDNLEAKVINRTSEIEKTNQKLIKAIFEKEETEKFQSQLITAIESAVESIIITTTNGEIIYANPSFYALTGYSPGEVVGNNPKVLKSGFHNQSVYENLWKTISNGGVWKGIFTNKKKDGTLYQEDSTIAPVFNGNGDIVNYVAVKKDITKEQELQEQLKQSQKLESIGTLAAGIAHEINTPAQFVLGNMEFIADAAKDINSLIKRVKEVSSGAGDGISVSINDALEEADWEYLAEDLPQAIEQSQDGIRRISSIVQAMKEFSHPGSKEKSEQDINKIIKTTVTVARNEWKYLATIDLELAQNLPKIPLLTNEISQVILNMIINAVHGIREKVGSSPEGQLGTITLKTGLIGDNIELRIQDTGAGIPEEARNYIFDPFFTTKEVGCGTGQGLAISYDIIVNKHGGSIRFSTETGVGTEFIINLPVHTLI